MTAPNSNARETQEQLFSELNEPHERGDSAESIVKTAFAVRGITVLSPEHDNSPYDFAIDVEGLFYRVQAKTAYEGTNQGAVRFETRSTRVKRSGYEREDYTGKIELFAVYNPINGDIYLVSIEGATTSSMAIRYELPANGNRTNVNWHEEYLIDTVLPSL